MALLRAALETWYCPRCTVAASWAIREARSEENALIADDEFETEMLSPLREASSV
jgi:hypothetical protein